MKPSDYSFRALLEGKTNSSDPSSSLCYLVSLTNSAHHKISETLPAKRILSWQYGSEEQAQHAEDLKSAEEFFLRYFPDGFYPQTPCMVVQRWSPIAALLERGMEPQMLNREEKFRAVATGIWAARGFSAEEQIDSATTDEALFWAIMGQVSCKALKRKMWISIIAQPGWDYDHAINSLPAWPAEEVAKSDRVLWKRTPHG